MPEQPPPRTPTRRKTSSPSFWAPLSSFTCFFAVSLSASAMTRSPPQSLLRLAGRYARRRRGVLFLEIREGRLDGILGKHRAMNLHGRQLQLVDDVRVLDLLRLVDGLALEPFRGQAR